MTQNVGQHAIINLYFGLPWWHSGWESARAGDTGSIPGWEDSTCRRTTKARAPQEKPGHHNEEWPLLAATREEPEWQWRPSTTKNKYTFKKFTYEHNSDLEICIFIVIKTWKIPKYDCSATWKMIWCAINIFNVGIWVHTLVFTK